MSHITSHLRKFVGRTSDVNQEFSSASDHDHVDAPDDFWKDECVLSSSRGYICSPPDTTGYESPPQLPPEIMYGGTSAKPEHPSLVITGGCCQTCEGLLKTAPIHPPKPAPLHKWAYYSKLEESVTRNCNVCKIIRQTIMKHSAELPDLEEWNPGVRGTPIFSRTGDGDGDSDSEHSSTEFGGFVLHLTPDPTLDLNVPMPTRDIEIKASKRRQDLPNKPRGFDGKKARLLYEVLSRMLS